MRLTNNIFSSKQAYTPFMLGAIFLTVGLTTVFVDSLPNIPAPIGYIDGSCLSETIRSMGLIGQPPSSKLVGLYYPTNVLADILNKGSSTPSPFCKALITKEYTSVSEARKGFQTLVKNAKKEKDNRFDPRDPAIRRIFAYYENMANKVEPDISINVSGMSMLGTLLEKDTIFASSMILNFRWTENQTKNDMPFAVSLAWMRLGIQQIEVSVMYPFRNAESVTIANQKLLEWIFEIEKRN